MEDYFAQIENQPQIADSYQPPTSQPQDLQNVETFNYAQSNPIPYQPPVFEFDTPSNHQNATNFTEQPSPENDFNDFEEDETSRRIREDEQKIQNLLRERSQREYQDKCKRQEQGRRQLQVFQSTKEEQQIARTSENIRLQNQRREEIAKLNEEAGWRKVVTNINVRHGEHKGKKDTSRMREAILHRREDDTR